MDITEREFTRLQRRVDQHDEEINKLQVDLATIHGAAKEGARFGTILVAVISIFGMIAQVAIGVTIH